MAKMRDFETPNKISRGSFTYAKFAKLKELAKNSIGESDETFEIEFDTILNLYNEIDSKINSLDKQISTIVKELNPPTLSIPGIGELTTAVIISEFGDFSKFSNSAQLLSFAGLEPGIYQSGTMLSYGKMVKRGSGYLRGALMNISNVVIKYNPTLYDYYLKKRSEGKCHRVALSHVCKKLLRVIYKLETQNIQFDPSLLK